MSREDFSLMVLKILVLRHEFLLYTIQGTGPETVLYHYFEERFVWRKLYGVDNVYDIAYSADATMTLQL